jgi:hypothetical protein
MPWFFFASQESWQVKGWEIDADRAAETLSLGMRCMGLNGWTVELAQGAILKLCLEMLRVCLKKYGFRRSRLMRRLYSIGIYWHWYRFLHYIVLHYINYIYMYIYICTYICDSFINHQPNLFPCCVAALCHPRHLCGVSVGAVGAKAMDRRPSGGSASEPL